MTNIISAITCVLVAVSVPCAGQSSRTSFSVMREYVAADQVSSTVAIPENLQFEPPYRPLLESMLAHSPTFRRQLLRVASEPGLTVHLHPAGYFFTRGARALSHITRDARGLHADIFLSGLDDHVELIAHELEHVIEQLDRVDLSLRASLKDTGVRNTLSDGETFETTRATLTGLRVAREVAGVRRAD